MNVIAPEDPRLIQAATTSIAIELQDSRSEAAAAASDAQRSWFDGRAQGLERALELLGAYQRRA